MQMEIQFTSSAIIVPRLTLPTREIGACVEFHGVVRELEKGQPLAGLHYEAYEPMARLQLTRIFTQLATQHACAAVTLIHRLGWVPVGETSLYIAVLSAHRGEALRFLAEAIDRLKTDVPIWKRTERESGEMQPLPQV